MLVRIHQTAQRYISEDIHSQIIQSGSERVLSSTLIFLIVFLMLRNILLYPKALN